MQNHNLLPNIEPSARRLDPKEVRRHVLSRLQTNERICREMFLTSTPYKKQQKKQFRVINAVFQQLVVDGILFTVDRAGDYAFFRHHGRAFPKMWARRRRITPEDK